VDFLGRHKVPRARAILCVFTLAVVLILGFFGSVVPQIVVETRDLVNRIPAYATKVQKKVEHWINHPPGAVLNLLRTGAPTPDGESEVRGTNTPAPEVTVTNAGVPVTVSTNAILAPRFASGTTTGTNAPAAGPPVDHPALALWNMLVESGQLQSTADWFAHVLPKIGRWLFGQVLKVASWFGFLAGLVLIPVYAFYFLLEKEGIERNWTDYLPVADSSFKNELVFVLRSINDHLIVFFRGQVLVAFCDGALYTVGFLIIGLPYALLIGAMATVLTLIPFLGAIVTCVTALVVALVQFGDLTHLLIVGVVFAVVQSVEGYVLIPRIIGERVGLHPVTVIIAIMVGTTVLGGVLGAILAIPLTAALRVLMTRYVWRTPQLPSPAAPAPAASPSP
jgi:predicted PurR-regulated permease PerM